MQSAKLIYRRLLGTTLIETLIAMTILIVITVIGFMIFTQVIFQNLSNQKLKASLILKVYADSTLTHSQYFDDTWQNDDISLIRKVETNDAYSGIIQLHFTAFNRSGNLLSEEKKLVLK